MSTVPGLDDAVPLGRADFATTRAWSWSGTVPGAASCVALATLVAAALLTLGNPPYSADSWSYLDLAQEIGTDFYHVDVIRQYQFEPGYGASFPPLLPVLMAGVLALAPVGIYAGSFLNLAVAAATLPVLTRLARLVCGRPAVGAALFLGLVGNREYLVEVVAGRSIPLALLLFLSALAVFLADRTPRRDWLVGVLAGAVTLARFDFLLGGIVLGVAVAIDSPGRRFAALARFLVAYAATLAPWSVYSLHHFGRVFVSDNTRTVLLAEPSHVLNFFPTPPPSLFDAPGRWLVKSLAHVRFVCGERFPLALVSDRMFLLLVVLAAGLALRERVAGGRTGGQRARGHDQPSVDAARVRPPIRLLLPGMALVVVGLSVALTGYKPLRYHLLAVAFLDICLLAFIERRFVCLASPRADAALVAATLAVVVVPTLARHVRESGFVPPTRLDPRLLANADDRAAVAALDDPRRARVLFLEPAGVLQSYRFGAQTGVDTYVDPRNLDERSAAEFIARYGITHVVTADRRWRERLGRIARIEPVDERLSLLRLLPGDVVGPGELPR